ncbi:MAG: Type 1 glutamine amidotransferase-like domain-containing protein [Dehalococcoidia bacterium]
MSWRSGAGWIVLIGGTSDEWRATEAIDRAAIDLMDRERPIAFMPAAACPPDYGESFLETYRRLGAPAGYVVPVLDRASASDPANAELLRRAGLIYFGGGETVELLKSVTGTPALEALAAAHDAGAVIVGMSAGAIALAERGVPLNPSIGVLQGWAWLARAVVSVHHTPARHAGLRAALLEHAGMLGIGLPEDAAIALGPDGQLQAWGQAELTVIAGADFEPSP